jgi:hypothetical protein
MELFYPHSRSVYGNLPEKIKNIGSFAEFICKYNLNAVIFD